MNRREFLAMLAAGGVMTAAGIWMPGEKVISIPSHKYFLPPGSVAWFDGLEAYVQRRGGVIQVPEYFDVLIEGAELVKGLDRV